MSGSGQSVIVYPNQAGSGNAIVARYEYPPSWLPYSGLPDPITVSSGAGTRSEPRVAMSRYGYWMAVWKQTLGDITHVMARQYRGLEPAGPEFTVAIVSHAPVLSLNVATNLSGSRYTVAWSQGHPSAVVPGAFDYKPHARIVDSMQVIQDEVVLTEIAGNLPISMAQSDDASYFAWSGFHNARNALMAAKLDHQSGAVSYQPLEYTVETGDTSMDATAAGEVVVVYPLGLQLMARRLTSNLVPSDAVPVTVRSHSSSKSDVALTRDGRFTIAWNSDDYGGDLLARAFEADGTPIGPEVAFAARNPWYAGLGLAADADGDAIAVWSEMAPSLVTARRLQGMEPVDVAVDAFVSPGSIDPGTPFEYHIDVRNLSAVPPFTLEGYHTATGLSVSVTPPAGATVVSAEGERWHCDMSATIDCVYDDTLSAGQTARSLNVYLVAPASAGVISGEVRTSAHQQDPDGANNIESVTSRIGDTDPDAFSFPAATSVPRSTEIVSIPVTITGIDAPTRIAVSPNGRYRINGGSFTSADGSVLDGDVVEVAHTSASSFNTSTLTYLTVGTRIEEFKSTTEFADGTPDAFAFADVSGAARSALVESNVVTISGINTTVALNVTGGEYSLNGGPYTSSSGVAQNGASLRVRHTSSAGFGAATHTTLSVGTYSDTFTSTTIARDTTPDAFAFADVTGSARNAAVTSNEIVVAGINDAASIGVTGGSYSIDGGVFTSAAGTVTNGQRVRVQLTTAPGFSTATNATLTIGGVSDTFTATTEAQDATPDAFAFADQSGVATNVSVTSAPITIAGTNSPATATVTGGEMSVNGGAFGTASATVNAGDQIRVRHTTSSSANTAVSTTVTVGGVSDAFSSTTGATDTTPNAFAFADVTNAKKNSTVTSAPITVSGINAPVAISVSGGSASYSVNGGAFRTTAGTMSNGQTVVVRITTPNAFGVTTNVVVTIGGLADTWSVTTR